MVPLPPYDDRLVEAESRDVPRSSAARFHVIGGKFGRIEGRSRRESSINGSIQALRGPRAD
jgi:hypothetical protein